MHQLLRLRRDLLTRPSGGHSCWRSWNEQSSLPSEFEKWVSGHYGGVGPHPNGRRVY
jgi:hypothetical protein